MHDMRTISIQGTKNIFDQNKPKISNSTKSFKKATNKPLEFSNISKLDINTISCTWISPLFLSVRLLKLVIYHLILRHYLCKKK